jgi:hypothetical protein
MFLTFISEIKPVLKNKPQITLSNAIRQPKHDADPEYIQYRKGYAIAGKMETCTYMNIKISLNQFNEFDL